MNPLRILVADDEYWVRENLLDLLKSLGDGFEVLEPAVDGEDALARVEAQRPDLLITDIDMPFLTGNQVIKALKKTHPDLQVLVLSGYSDYAYVREALVNGAQDYLLKPVNLDDLTRVIRQVEAVRADRTSTALSKDSVERRLESAQELLRDEALSALLSDDAESSPYLPGDEPIHLSCYTLVLVHLLDRRPTGGQSVPALRDRAARTKALVCREFEGFGRSGVFQNLLAPSEYVVLSDLDTPSLVPLAQRLSVNLAKLLGVVVEVAVSDAYFTLTKTAVAYRQARASLLVRPFDRSGGAGTPGNAPPVRLATRVNSEHEMLLNLAIAAGDGPGVLDILYRQIGLRTEAHGWLVAEVQQTLDYVVKFLLHRVKIPPASRLWLAQDAILHQLDLGVGNRDLDQVCRVLEEWIDEVFGAAAATTTSPSMRQTVRQVKDHIESHYFEELSLSSLAEWFHVDASYLSKAYKAVTGVNLTSAIASCRINRAKEFIQERDLSLTEIAAVVGYGEYAYFNRVFRRVTGVSPTEFKSSLGRAVDAMD